MGEYMTAIIITEETEDGEDSQICRMVEHEIYTICTKSLFDNPQFTKFNFSMLVLPTSQSDLIACWDWQSARDAPLVTRSCFLKPILNTNIMNNNFYFSVVLCSKIIYIEIAKKKEKLIFVVVVYNHRNR